MVQVPESEYARLMRLDAKVREVLAQRTDDLCWRDVYTDLAALVGMEFVPELICDRAKFLSNCTRFADHIYDGGPYVPVYVEQEDIPGQPGKVT